MIIHIKLIENDFKFVLDMTLEKHEGKVKLLIIKMFTKNQEDKVIMNQHIPPSNSLNYFLL